MTNVVKTLNLKGWPFHNKPRKKEKRHPITWNFNIQSNKKGSCFNVDEKRVKHFSRKENWWILCWKNCYLMCWLHNSRDINYKFNFLTIEWPLKCIFKLKMWKGVNGMKQLLPLFQNACIFAICIIHMTYFDHIF